MDARPDAQIELVTRQARQRARSGIEQIGRSIAGDGEEVGPNALDPSGSLRRPGDEPLRPFPKPVPFPLIDPPVWEQSATLPASAAGGIARLVLREFERCESERYDSDGSVPEMKILNVARKPPRRRVVEERLVYTEFFDL